MEEAAGWKWKAVIHPNDFISWTHGAAILPPKNRVKSRHAYDDLMECIAGFSFAWYRFETIKGMSSGGTEPIPTSRIESKWRKSFAVRR